MYTSLESMQADLDDWINYYNRQRAHSGKYCFGKTPLETFKDSIGLAKEKRIADWYLAADATS
ncbi:IS3 family transposase [Chitinophaga nivalis]|uniref:IS3 family transposase n=1 Tax=Chitinophaga nivalis TaxID=2991709 RepID=UPI003530935A